MVSIIGTIMHFIYRLSGNNILVGIIAPINESIWEHTKLIFFPMLLYSLCFSGDIKKNYPCITSATYAGTAAGVLLIIISFYTYSGVLGYHNAVIDTLIFYVSVIASFCFVYNITLSCKAEKYSIILQICIISIACAYIIFTFYQPNIALFKKKV